MTNYHVGRRFDEGHHRDCTSSAPLCIVEFSAVMPLARSLVTPALCVSQFCLVLFLTVQFCVPTSLQHLIQFNVFLTAEVPLKRETITWQLWSVRRCFAPLAYKPNIVSFLLHHTTDVKLSRSVSHFIFHLIFSSVVYCHLLVPSLRLLTAFIRPRIHSLYPYTAIAFLQFSGTRSEFTVPFVFSFRLLPGLREGRPESFDFSIGIPPHCQLTLSNHSFSQWT